MTFATRSQSSDERRCRSGPAWMYIAPHPRLFITSSSPLLAPLLLLLQPLHTTNFALITIFFPFPIQHRTLLAQSRPLLLVKDRELHPVLIIFYFEHQLQIRVSGRGPWLLVLMSEDLVLKIKGCILSASMCKGSGFSVVDVFAAAEGIGFCKGEGAFVLRGYHSLWL